MNPIRNPGCDDPGSPRIGVIGGSFDPVHIAHLIIAEEARVRLGLERVLFVPAGRPYLKFRRGITPAPDRLEMARLAVASNKHFEVSTIDIERPGPSYTVDTLDMLRSRLPQENRIYFIIGMDGLETLPLWREPGRILEMCRLVAAPRPGVARPDLKRLDQAIPGLSSRVIILEWPLLSISSTEIRQRVARGLSIRYLVPDAVEQYIREHRLYGDAEEDNRS